MIWWIWVSIIVYMCIGAWLGGKVCGQEDEISTDKKVGLTILFLFFWMIVLIVLIIGSRIIDYCEHRDINYEHIKVIFSPINWYNSIKIRMQERFKKIKKRIKKIFNKKNYDEFDEEVISEEEQYERYIRLGINSRVDVWDSTVKSAWDTDE